MPSHQEIPVLMTGNTSKTANLSTVSSTLIWRIAWQRTKNSLPDNSIENYSNNFQLLEHPLVLSREREENLVGSEKEPDTVPWLQRQTRRNDWSGVKRESRWMISSLVKSSSQTNAPSSLSHTKVCYQKQNEPAPLAKASTKNKCVGKYICKRGYFPCSRNTRRNKVHRNLGDVFDPFHKQLQQWQPLCSAGQWSQAHKQMGPAVFWRQGDQMLANPCIQPRP